LCLFAAVVCHEEKGFSGKRILSIGGCACNEGV
jgi:uncharacterized metal-binding protein